MVKKEILLRIEKYIIDNGLTAPGDKVLVGLSGGADSLCLFLSLMELRASLGIEVEVIHVEHGIRGDDSLSDMQFCMDICREKGLECHVCRIDAVSAAKDKGLSLEEAARILRYQCFCDVAKETGADSIAVAHHMDDNSETILFNMLRGSGIRGVAGMRPKRDNIIRPLLCISRRDIEAYLNELDQAYCTDVSNEDTDYSRNLIRQEIMPRAIMVNERAVEHMNRTGDELFKIWDYIHMQTLEAMKECLVDECDADGKTCRLVLDKEKTGNLHPVILRQLLFECFCRLAGTKKDIASKHIDMLEDLLVGAAGRMADLPYNVIGRSGYDKLFLYNKTTAEETRDNVDADRGTTEHGIYPHARLIDWDGDLKKIIEKTYTKWFDYDKIRNDIVFRHRQAGDYLSVTPDGGKKKLKDYFINEKIPADKRDDVWLLADGNHIMWVVGHRISQAYKVTENTGRILEIALCTEPGEDGCTLASFKIKSPGPETIDITELGSER